MIPPEYRKTSAYLVELEERYAIDGTLAGRQFDFRFSDSFFLSIVFPAIVRKDQFYEVGIPNPSKYRMDVVEDWGMIRDFGSPDSPGTVEIWVSKVLVLVSGIEPVPGDLFKCIQDEGVKLIHSLQVVNPDAIRIPAIDLPNRICRVRFSTWETPEGEQKRNVFRPILEDDRIGKLTFSDLMVGIQNREKVISTPYELLDNARVSLSNCDSRAAVLNCATALEVTLKRLLSEYLDTLTESSSLKAFVMSKANSFKQQVELCGKFSIPVTGITDVQKPVIDIRHKVIHGGYMPNLQEANKAYDVTRKALQALGVAMFECIPSE